MTLLDKEEDISPLTNLFAQVCLVHLKHLDAMLPLAVVLLTLMELLLRPPESSLNHLDMKDMVRDVIRRKSDLDQDLRIIINQT